MKLFDMLIAGGGEKGSSLPVGFLIEFSCLNTGVRTGGLPTRDLISIRGFGGAREDLFVETEVELPGLRGGTKVDKGLSSELLLSEQSDEVSESSFFRRWGTDLGSGNP